MQAFSSQSLMRHPSLSRSWTAFDSSHWPSSRVLWVEVGKRGVRVNVVVPGFVETRMTEGLPEQAVRQLRAAECLPQGTSAADVGRAVAFLLSQNSAAITGQTINVDSGASA